jgi:hypothetical protein
MGMPAYTSWYGPAQRGKFFLAGDSLAVTTPFGGQGMTCACLHAISLLELFQNGIPSDNNLRKLGRRYTKKTKAVYAHFNFLNTGIYHLFFSRQRLTKFATHHVLSGWAEEPALTQRLGRLFGGIDQDTPKMEEVFELWGLDFPNFYPLKFSGSKLPLHQVLVPLMNLTNQSLKVREHPSRGARAPRMAAKLLNLLWHST